MTPQEKVVLIEAKHKNQIRAFGKHMLEIMKSRRNLDHCAEKAIQIVNEMTAIVAPYSPCKKGCGYCCYQNIVISSWEAKRIAKFSLRKMNAVIGHEFPTYDTQEELSELANKFMGHPCPFLKKDACSIYEIRPFMCRLHVSLDNDNFNCNIIGIPNAIVPYFDFELTKAAIAVLFTRRGDSFADIREFFRDEDAQTKTREIG